MKTYLSIIIKNLSSLNKSPIKFIEFFRLHPSKIAFKDKKSRDDFNEGLKILKSSERYKEVFEKYLKE